MAYYESPKPYYLKDRREVAIDLFASKANISRADYIALGTIEQVEEALDIYRQEAGLMSRIELRNEEHDSTVLGDLCDSMENLIQAENVMPTLSYPAHTLEPLKCAQS